MKYVKKSMSGYLVDGDTFRFIGDSVLYEVFDFVKYRKYGSKTKGNILPSDKRVILHRTSK